MSGGRWSYKYEAVTVDGNTIWVRGLTYGERQRFVQLSKDARAGHIDAKTVPGELLKMAADATAEDLDGIPYELLEAAVEKVMALSGLGDASEPEPPQPSAPAEEPLPQKKA